MTKVKRDNQEMIKMKKLSAIAMLLTLSASLAFAGEKTNSAASSDTAQPAASEQAPCVTSKAATKAKSHKQEPTDQEKEFDRVLMGIFG
jgi:hypothetical protein